MVPNDFREAAESDSGPRASRAPTAIPSRRDIGTAPASQHRHDYGELGFHQLYQRNTFGRNGCESGPGRILAVIGRSGTASLWALVAARALWPLCAGHTH